jgi:hypothetical protein
VGLFILIFNYLRDLVEQIQGREKIINAAYDAFACMLNNFLFQAKHEQAYRSFEQLPSHMRKMLALHWSLVLDYAEKTDSFEILCVYTKELDGISETGKGVFTLAAESYAFFYPDGHKSL